MTNEDRAGFAEAIAALAVVHAQELTEERVALYFEALDDLELAEVRRAVRESNRHSRYFPKPAELRAFVRSAPVLNVAMYRPFKPERRRLASPVDLGPLLAATVLELEQHARAHQEAERANRQPVNLEERRAVLRDQAARLRNKPGAT